MPANTTELEKRLWDAADELRANSRLKSSEYSVPVLGLIFLRYADWKFTQAEKVLKSQGSGRRGITKTDYQAKGVMYLPENARFSQLLELPESADFGKAINQAMKAIEDENTDLNGALPKNYNRLDNELLIELLKKFSKIDFDADIEGDAFGKIYEYFLGKFAMSEGQKGGEFFTPTSIVKLIVEILEPYYGRIYDPACGSGGMFVQSAKFVGRHKKNPSTEISIYGQEKVGETVNLCQMNLAVHGLSGNIKQGNTYYEVNHANIDIGQFDFVMANPPFNVDKVDKERMQGDVRFKDLGLPKVDNANYIWIHLFYSALNETGRAGFVMANSASDARGSELEIRKKLIQLGVVDVMVAIGSNFFYTVTLPCTLWFLDKGKCRDVPVERLHNRKNKVLFLDARHIYTQVDRAHREFTAQQIEFIANIVRLYRGEAVENTNRSDAMLLEKFPEGKYIDVAGLCKVATIEEIEAQGWSLNPGRYVGVAERVVEDFDFAEKLEELNEELEVLNTEARELEERIAENVSFLLEQS
ncbi:SAM-dependent DNA methyltransferase [Nostoc sp. CENA67]|uniref:site-specific DNA-methyltransferase (adenine-specific) n=1 Tax=Amazonocrinis nigriterrae CENA67 TaxID=2794033 RepID=A0A8J7LAQ4_9NOST|nr:class I SAM-dependent DNA methyltransferase [Amazonocrinis nigriterrae]MBH8564406.1 SAM-dependent DNA methyltransferase [Amazonocrinis nigriterrae CENA67]